jgi:cell division protein FtsQ
LPRRHVAHSRGPHGARVRPAVRRLPRVPLRWLLALAALAILLGGGWLWLRDSSLVQVRDVEVTGSSSSEEGRIRAALEDAALDMTTLHVREESLRTAVAPYTSVAGLRVETDFPHALTIEVREHRPVAALDTGDRRVPVSGGGVVLAGVRADRDLPSIELDSVPPRVEDARTRAALAVAAAAPEALLARTERLEWTDQGLGLELRDGPPLVFGSHDDAEAKWAAAARVLAEPSAAGATYIDLRVPGRVAAGGLGPVPQETPEPDPAAVPQP